MSTPTIVSFVMITVVHSVSIVTRQICSSEPSPHDQMRSGIGTPISNLYVPVPLNPVYLVPSVSAGWPYGGLCARGRCPLGRAQIIQAVHTLYSCDDHHPIVAPYSFGSLRIWRMQHALSSQHALDRSYRHLSSTSIRIKTQISLLPRTWPALSHTLQERGSTWHGIHSLIVRGEVRNCFENSYYHAGCKTLWVGLEWKIRFKGKNVPTAQSSST